MAVEFKCEDWSVQSYSLTCAPKTYTAGRGFGGHKQVVRIKNNYWRGSITLNPLFGQNMISYRGFIGSLEGSGGEFDWCICDPFALKGEGKTQEEWLKLLGYDVSSLCGPDSNGLYGEPFADGTCFVDGTGFYIPPFSKPRINTPVSAGVSEIDFGDAAGFLKCGNYFSTSDGYLHKITKINTSVVSFTPALRRSLSVGEVIETQNPKLRVRLSSDESGTPDIEYARYTGPITLNIEEVMNR
tara:strand:- start:1112 stop:1837 length:726 start_codon:yes stop_codon:yes gene_type:complete